MDLKCKLEKQKDLKAMELAPETDSNAYKKDSSVENNEVQVNCRLNKKRPMLVRSRTGNFNNVQEAAGMPT
jgi:hypothetical protein